LRAILKALTINFGILGSVVSSRIPVENIRRTVRIPPPGQLKSFAFAECDSDSKTNIKSANGHLSLP
jgi:hypothetical protein